MNFDYKIDKRGIDDFRYDNIFAKLNYQGPDANNQKKLLKNRVTFFLVKK